VVKTRVRTTRPRGGTPTESTPTASPKPQGSKQRIVGRKKKPDPRLKKKKSGTRPRINQLADRTLPEKGLIEMALVLQDQEGGTMPRFKKERRIHAVVPTGRRVCRQTIAQGNRGIAPGAGEPI